MIMSLLPIDEKKDALQPNEQEVDLDAAWRRVRSWVYVALGLLLAVAVGLSVYFHLKNREEETELAAQSMLVEAPNEAALQAVIEKYPSADAALQALMLLAFHKYEEGDWKSARESYQKVYEKAMPRQPDLAASGLFGVGAAYEAEKNYGKSLEVYATLARQYPNSFKTVEAKMNEARVYELKGDLDKARKSYENIIVSYPRSEWKTRAEQRKKIIESRAK